MGRNKLNDKRLLQYNNNFITYLPKTTSNNTQKNLSYIKSKQYSIRSNIKLSPIKKNDNILFGRPTSLNKRKNEEDNSDERNKREHRKNLISILISDEGKIDSIRNFEKRK